MAIKSFRHKGLRKFHATGTTAGIQAKHVNKLQLQLTALSQAVQPADMNAPGWELHPLHGKLEGHWAVTVNGNWRLTFAFDGRDAIVVDYQDYSLTLGKSHDSHVQPRASRRSAARVSW